MSQTLLAQVRALQQMSVAELRAEWSRLHDGQAARSFNKQFLFRRLAFRLQELAQGGLSERARARAAELARDADLRVRPRPGAMDAFQRPSTPAPVIASRQRDRRLPSPGTVLTRTYRGRELRLLVRDDGFELDGVFYRSLSAAAKAATGAKWNGPLFWGLTRRAREA